MNKVYTIIQLGQVVHLDKSQDDLKFRHILIQVCSGQGSKKYYYCESCFKLQHRSSVVLKFFGQGLFIMTTSHDNTI